MNDEKKLEVDEDWKSQVEREKESIRSKSTAGAGEEPESHQSETRQAKTDSPEAEAESRELPPASLIILISSLATQAMASMGQLLDDDGKPMPKNLKFAKHFIDLIAVIEDKSRNNLTNEENTFLSSTLHHLRMQFVEASRL